MSLTPETPVKELGPIGRRCAKALGKLGIETVEDLLWHLPSRYEDFSETATLAGAGEGPATFHVRVDMIRGRRSPKKRMLLTEAMVSDGSAAARVVWFRQPYLTKIIRQGDRLFLTGTVTRKPWGLELVGPGYEKDTGKGPVHSARLVPVYPLAGSLTAKQVRALLHGALAATEMVEETLDEPVRRRYGLMPLPEALRVIHFPEDREAATAADRRFRFEELFMFQLRGAWARRALEARRAPHIPLDGSLLREFASALPFTLTDDQKKVIWRIVQELDSGHAMHRLVEGDVGSGKTVVAAAAMHVVAEAGYGSLLLAPTEILAEQHHRNLASLLNPFGREAALRTRHHRIGSEDAPVVVGTHALLGEKVTFGDIGLLVVDEQHRFGVGQRRTLLARLEKDGIAPHFLSMTATPIPRTLALALYGDVDLSRLREMPAGRRPVRTLLISEGERDIMEREILEEVRAGRRAFVVCPLIEASDALGVRSAEDEAERLKGTVLGEARIGLLHGRMKGDEKKAVMERFRSGEIDVLVSTTVVEVGVDVPEATVMVIEGAERFGLAQLHQLRGRVGRSDIPSACYLVMTDEGGQARARLEGFTRAKDCFELAELDLRMRGPGSLFGDAQSGFADLKRFDPDDTRLIEEAKEAAAEILKKDPRLDTHPHLREIVTAHAAHLE